MTDYLSSGYFPSQNSEEDASLASSLTSILNEDFHGNYFEMMAGYQRLLADNQNHDQWPIIHNKLETLFKCGKAAALNGPMIGIPVAIRDSDYFKDAVNHFGKKRSMVASIEWMASAWNATFADTGLWMGKTFEPVDQAQVAKFTADDPESLSQYNNNVTRLGRNFFREPPDPTLVQGLGLPALSELWHLKNRPTSIDTKGFSGKLRQENLDKESLIPYSKTGGIFLANMGASVVPEMNNKPVYQLNYRWDNLDPVFPMTLLVDELVQIADGLYLGQLVYATKHYNMGSIDIPLLPGDQDITLGEKYKPSKEKSLWARIIDFLLNRDGKATVDYGYQNNGYFLMMDPAYAKDVYADNAFPQLRPRAGEMGWEQLGYKQESQNVRAAVGDNTIDWVEGWKDHGALRDKFTTFIQEKSPRASDTADITKERHNNESVLQMLQRISEEITLSTHKKDKLKHFEKLHQLFRIGVAPSVKQGLFRGNGKKGFNTNFDSPSKRSWYGEQDPVVGFNYYHGATLNLHWGFNETFTPDLANKLDDSLMFPSALATLVQDDKLAGPNLMNMMWRSIGKYVFPWAGKSFENISGRKLSMLLDESDDLAQRYPERVKQLKTYLASAPHYDLVKNNQNHYWPDPGKFAEHLQHGSWDNGMQEADKMFWQQEANNNWVFGWNLQDKRILAMDVIMRIADMNYVKPDPALQNLSLEGPSPFARQGYIFLGAANQSSILPMNNGEQNKKNVFQFQYRYPMIGGAVPIGFCLDEIVEIADGLFLGQLIYSTALSKGFHSSVDSSEYKYQLFGYFLLLDDDWERHRQAIDLDVWRQEKQQSEKTGLFSIF